MRSCANCGTSIDCYRRQARYCGGPCRAAASRARAAERNHPAAPVVAHAWTRESAQNRTQRLPDTDQWTLATPAEEALADRLRRDYPDLRGVV